MTGCTGLSSTRRLPTHLRTYCHLALTITLPEPRAAATLTILSEPTIEYYASTPPRLAASERIGAANPHPERFSGPPNKSLKPTVPLAGRLLTRLQNPDNDQAPARTPTPASDLSQRNRPANPEVRSRPGTLWKEAWKWP